MMELVIWLWNTITGNEGEPVSAPEATPWFEPHG